MVGDRRLHVAFPGFRSVILRKFAPVFHGAKPPTDRRTSGNIRARKYTVRVFPERLLREQRGGKSCGNSLRCRGLLIETFAALNPFYVLVQTS